jgi:HK97 family phage major capsid protein
MRTSIGILNDITRLQNEQRAVPQNATDRAEQLYTLDGRIQQLQAELEDTLAAEDAARNTFASTATVVGGNRRSVTEQLFGSRNTFAGVKPGFRAAVTIPSGPVVNPNIPDVADAPRGFVDTITQAPTTGVVEYFRRGTVENAAAQWAGSGEKAESNYTWTLEQAPLVWIAHHTPITKTQASDWSQLDAKVRTALGIGLGQANNAAALKGANASGITGVANTEGVLVYDIAEDGEEADNLYDSIRRMATRVYLTSGFAPTHVAMSPQVHETLDLLKDDEGRYLRVETAGQTWNLQIVDDVALTTTDEEGTHNSVLVYASIGATWYTTETDNVEVGLVDSQFIENAYTLLAEGRHALGVEYPDAFCYCLDAIPVVESEGS